ncbi:universal stress protein [Halobacteria archaeon AArc-m2/3/4]|uniref:Universal stress protein n=1 Tax=Natronoglomus mannanivorans TaxID=2979990 RepID=A0ABT2QM59_9EURY|nr:universal stress protein [Halobacteria archaeon AArc-m2/3/4]
MYDDVLLATDGSDTASKAVMQGFEIAAKFNASVHILCIGAHAEQANGETSVIDAADSAETIIQTAKQKGRDFDVGVQLAVRTGRPHQEILTYADQQGIDLLVLGTQGRTGLRKFVLGSVATSVVREATQPVLTVSKNVTNVRSTFHEFLIPTSGRPGTAAAITHGIELSAAYSARVHAVYVVDDTISRAPAYLDTVREFGREATNAVAVQSASTGVGTMRQILRGDPATKIQEYIGSHGVDLVVMGTERRAGVDRLVLGSVTERVLASAPVPVLTVRAHET